MTTNADIAQEIKSALNLIEEFRADGSDMIQSGKEFKCNCPFHGEDTSSCQVHVDFFKCFGCGEKGDIFNYLGLKIGKDSKVPADFVEILREGAKRAGIEFVEKSDKPKEPEKPRRVYPTIEKLRQCCEWVAGEQHSTIAEWNESTNPDGGAVEFIEVRLHHKTAKRANGKPRKTFLQCEAVQGGFQIGLVSGTKKPLFNRTRIRENPFIVLVEGCGCMKLLQSIGICATTAAGGSNNPVENVNYEPLRGKCVAIWPDNDAGGLEFAESVRKILETICERVYVVNIADLNLQPKDDVVDFYQRFQGDTTAAAEAISEIIANSEPETLRSQLDANISGKRYAIKHESFKSIATTLCFLPGSVTMICAGPGTSKSFLVLQWIWQLFLDGVDAAALALEKDLVFHEARNLAQMAGQSGILNPDWCARNPDEVNRIYDTFSPMMQNLRAKKVIQCPSDKHAITPEYLLGWVETEAKRGRKMLAIDPITKLETAEDFWQQQQKFVRQIVALVSKLKVRLILVTHPKKGAQGIHLDNMAGAVAFSQNTDTCVWLEAHPVQFQKRQNAMNPMIEDQVKFNRTLHIIKAKLGPVEKPCIGYWYGGNLIHEDVGFIESAG